MIQRRKTSIIVKDGVEIVTEAVTEAVVPREIYIQPQWGPAGIQGATITYRTEDSSHIVQMSDLPEQTAQQGYKFFADAFEAIYILDKSPAKKEQAE